MSQTVTLFFALLAIALVVLALTVVVLLIVDRGDRTGVLSQVRPVALELATAVAVTCTVGSLYLSEIVGYEPCRLCWVQRGFMYPSALLLIAALITRRRPLVIVPGLLASVGILVSIYHRYEQETGGSGFCDPTVPCSLKYVEELGFITIPTMAGAGFLGIIVLTGLHLFWRKA